MLIRVVSGMNFVNCNVCLWYAYLADSKAFLVMIVCRSGLRSH